MEEKQTEQPQASVQEAPEMEPVSPLGKLPPNRLIIGLAAVIIFMAGVAFDGEQYIAINTAAAAEVNPAPDMAAAVTGSTDAIERKNEGRLFYRSIRIPAGAETLYVSGSGADQKEDGTWGNMEEQAISTFEKFQATLEAEGWSMADVVQVRAFAVAGDYGLLDFEGFNRGYSRFFGTQDNPNKPVRSFVQVADLVVDGWLVEVEIRAARMPE